MLGKSVAAIAVVAAIAIFNWHDSVQQMATTLTVTFAIITTYLAAETFLLVRRTAPRTGSR